MNPAHTKPDGRPVRRTPARNRLTPPGEQLVNPNGRERSRFPSAFHGEPVADNAQTHSPSDEDTQGARVAVVGATGAVGHAMLETLERRAFPLRELRLMASARSAGRTLQTPLGERTVEDLAEASFADVDIALFSPGSAVSRAFAPAAASEGAVVVDNTSAFRMDDDTPLVVPEVNAHAIGDAPEIIANPNCSTIQLMLPLLALERAVGLKSVRVATYQSASGAGQKGVDELVEGTRRWLDDPPSDAESHGESDSESTARVHARPLPFNTVPWIGSLGDDPSPELAGYTTEELKMVHETRKILERPNLLVSATCVRVPVLRSHCEVVHVVTDGPIGVADARGAMSEIDNLVVVDDPSELTFPTARDGEGSFDTLVGRVRRDPVDENGLVFWVVSDNLLKGAAFNAVQIAEHVWKRARAPLE